MKIKCCDLFFASGSAADPHLLCLHIHRRSDGRHHHPGSNPHHHLLHGGHQTQLLWGLLVHASPLHRLFRRSGYSRNRVCDCTYLLLFFWWNASCCCCFWRQVWAFISSSEASWGGRPICHNTTSLCVTIAPMTGGKSPSVPTLDLLEDLPRFVLFCYIVSPTVVKELTLRLWFLFFRHGIGSSARWLFMLLSVCFVWYDMRRKSSTGR